MIPKAKAARLGHDMGKADSARSMQEMPAGKVLPVPKASPDWHPYAIGWYNSLALSGQSRDYEPSDWVLALVGAQLLSNMLDTERVPAGLFAEWSDITVRLCCALGDRRRARIDLIRAAGSGAAADADEIAAITSLAEYRASLA